MKELVMVKLGGSLVTDKSRPYTARPKVIKSLVSQVRRFMEKHGEIRILIGNGGGSFPHTSATKFGTANGYINLRGQMGACVVEDDAVKINRIVIGEMIKQGLSAVGIAPSSIMMTKNKKLIYCETKVIEQLLKSKIIPVVFGDVIWDIKIGCCIYSCDEVIEKLAQKLKYRIRIISAGDYGGVMDERGKVIKQIDKKYFEKLERTGVVGKSKSADVTGGMRAKIKTLLSSPKNVKETLIIDGRIRNNLYKAMIRERFIGTRILSTSHPHQKVRQR